MRFRPKANDRITLNGIEYSFAPHPHASSLAHGQEGGRATVYRLNAASNTLYETKALKVFKDQYRIPQIGEISDKLAQYASISGLGVCYREVLRPDQYNRPPLGEEELKWAVLMPWVEGNTWYDILSEKSDIDTVVMRVVVQKYLDVLLDLERNAVTHCDLSPANILVRLRPSPEVNLIDVEEMCAVGIPAPEMLPRGTAGYAHRSAHLGLWHPFADRFAGALLLCEMVCWSESTFRECAAGDSFFDFTEMHSTTCQRYHVMVQALEKVGGLHLVDLFKRCWLSTDLAQAPAFWEWSAGLSQYFNNKVMVSQPPNNAYLQQQIVHVTRQLTYKRMRSMPEEQVAFDQVLALLQRQLKAEVAIHRQDLQGEYSAKSTTPPTQASSAPIASINAPSVVGPRAVPVKKLSSHAVQSRTQHSHIPTPPYARSVNTGLRLSLKQILMFLGSILMLLGIVAVTSVVFQNIKAYMNTPQTNVFLDWLNTNEESTKAVVANPTATIERATPVPVVVQRDEQSGPTQIEVPIVAPKIVAVAAGMDHSLLLTRSGKVVAWGRNDHGQTDVPSDLRDVVAVAAGGSHSLAVTRNGVVVAWGMNRERQTDVPSGLRDVVAVAAGGSHSLALTRSGEVVAWGSNEYGQTNVPSDLRDVIALSGGWFHSIAVTRSGEVVAWGQNDLYGQTNVPSNLRDVVAVAGAGSHSLAVTRSGDVVAWGRNATGQTDVPSDLRDVVALAGGWFHSFALTRSGEVVAWGGNEYGQTNVPSDLRDVVQVAGGGSHSLALTRSGDVIAWGWNLFGQTNVPTIPDVDA